MSVFRNTEEVAKLTLESLDILRGEAARSPLHRARFCLHRSKDAAVHEMIIALTSWAKFPAHRHPNKEESIHILEGKLSILLFHDDGSRREAITLEPQATFAYRLCGPVYHTVRADSPIAIYYETTSGPWSEGDAELAPWEKAE